MRYFIRSVNSMKPISEVSKSLKEIVEVKWFHVFVSNVRKRIGVYHIVLVNIISEHAFGLCQIHLLDNVILNFMTSLICFVYIEIKYNV